MQVLDTRGNANVHVLDTRGLAWVSFLPIAANARTNLHRAVFGQVGLPGLTSEMTLAAKKRVLSSAG